MKKWIIGSLVGAIIVFAWQAASWMFLGLHEGSMKYTPAQGEILNSLSSNLKEDGMYFLPTAAPGTSQDDHVKMLEEHRGKPWAWVIYSTNWNPDMTASMIGAFVINLLLVILLISILVRGGLPSFVGIVTGCIAVGLFAFLTGPYMQRNWYNTPWDAIQGHLIDAIVAWGLVGLWLGWWLRRPTR